MDLLLRQLGQPDRLPAGGKRPGKLHPGWAMAGCFVGALVLLALAVVLAGLGSCAEQEEDEKPCKERQPQEKRAADRRKAG